MLWRVLCAFHSKPGNFGGWLGGGLMALGRGTIVEPLTNLLLCCCTGD